MRRLNKKAGMELSINAIVILIIAMIVLALGVVFVRGLFVKAGGKLGGAITGAQVAKPASPDEPITVDPTEVQFSISRGEKAKTIVLSVFNTGATANIVPGIPGALDITLPFGCKSTAADAINNADIKLLAPSQAVENNKLGNWNALLTVNTSKITSGNSAVCTVTAIGTATGSTTPILTISTSFTIAVTD